MIPLRHHWESLVTHQQMLLHGPKEPVDLHRLTGIPLHILTRGHKIAMEHWEAGNRGPQVEPQKPVQASEGPKEYQLTKPVVEPAKGKNGKKPKLPKNPAIEQTSNDHGRLIEMWTTQYEQKFGRKYAFTGKDAKAAKIALDTRLKPEELMEIVAEAWEHVGDRRDFFNCALAVDFMGFANNINKIQHEIDKLPAKGPSIYAKVFEQPLEFKIPGHRTVYTMTRGPDPQDFSGADAVERYSTAERSWRQWRQTQNNGHKV